jgi:hypothetical protein
MNEQIVTFIHHADETLDEKAMINANRAFNSGCLLSLIPSIIIIVLTYIISGGGWIPAAITATLLMIAVLLFANFTAYTARNRTMDRVFKNEIYPDIQNFIIEEEISQEDFNRLASYNLPIGASLLRCLNIESSEENNESIE